MANFYTNNTTSRQIIPFLAIWVLLFFGITIQVVQAQYYDLRVGTERYYNEWGNGTNPILVAPTGIRDNPIYLFERVIDEAIVNDTTWAVVEIDTYRTNYFPSQSRTITSNQKDTVYLRMDESRLIQLNKGKYSVLMDFNLAVGDTIDIVLEEFQNKFWTDLIRTQSPRPVVFADTIIAFPDESMRRIIFGDSRSSHLFDDYEYSLSALDLVENAMPVHNNMPYPFFSDKYTSIMPFYFIEGAGVMFSIHSQRGSLFMTGFKPVDGPMMGSFEDAPEVTSLEPTVEMPKELAIQSYPNPFNPTTTLEVKVPTSGQTQIHVYNAIGQQVAQLQNGMLTAGIHQFAFNASSLSSGVYIVRVMQGELLQSHHVLLLK